jgi:hypothetical protein
MNNTEFCASDTITERASKILIQTGLKRLIKDTCGGGAVEQAELRISKILEMYKEWDGEKCK